MTNRKIVYLHGIGGPADIAQALSLLNDHLGGRGYPSVQKSNVVDVDYEAILKRPSGSTPKVRSTWAPGGAQRDQAREAYVARAARIQARMDRTGDGSASPLCKVPSRAADAATRAKIFRQVDRYASISDVRHAVWRAVLPSLPLRGEIVLIGHSLGSVIACDLVSRLPLGIVVRSLITLGSPLGFVTRLRKESTLLTSWDDFPFSRVQAWVNLYDPADVVTGGRGVGARYPRAVDVALSTGGHSLNLHLNHPATLEAIEEGLYATYALEKVGPPDVQRAISPAWVPQILGFAWSQQLGEAHAGKDQQTRRRLRAARQELARRSVSQYRQQLKNLDLEASSLSADTPDEVRAGIKDLHVFPSEHELVDTPAALVRGGLTDLDLVILLVPAVRSWPVAPFEVAVSPPSEVRLKALNGLLAKLRLSGEGGLRVSDSSLATQILDHIRAAEKDLAAKEGSAARYWVLAAVGAAALVAIPFTFGASVPAGLSGAAALTASLAAFGPGGMAGGIASIALLAGGGSLVAGTGTILALGEEEQRDRRDRARRGARRAQDFAQMAIDSPLPSLRESLVTLLAVLRLREDLGVGDSVAIYAAAERALGRLRVEYQLHREMAPDAGTTKDWNKRVELVEKFAGLLRPADLQKVPALEGR